MVKHKIGVKRESGSDIERARFGGIYRGAKLRVKGTDGNGKKDLRYLIPYPLQLKPKSVNYTQN